MKVIVISSTRKSKSEPEIATKLFENGLEIFHLRKPKFSEREMSDFIRQIPKEYWNKIVIHSHHNLAKKFNLKGIHLTRKHKNKKFRLWWKIKRMRINKLQVSTSFHNLSSLYEDPKDYGYVFISPVFDSISKGGYQSGFTEYSLSAAVKNSKHQVIALGGVNESKTEKIHEMGFDGMALLGAIWNSDNPIDVFKNITKQVHILHSNSKKIQITPVKLDMRTGS